jgi:predicted kinase
MSPRLIVMSGLPGSGKSEIAEAVGASIKAPVFAKDWVEAPLLKSGFLTLDQLGWLGYELLTTLADRQLALGQSAVLDSVAVSESIRSTWRELTRRHDAGWVVIECVCSDSELHRLRLDRRERGITGWPEPDWSEVERVRATYAPWGEPRLELDAVSPLSDNVARALAYLGLSHSP